MTPADPRDYEYYRGPGIYVITNLFTGTMIDPHEEDPHQRANIFGCCVLPFNTHVMRLFHTFLNGKGRSSK